MEGISIHHFKKEEMINPPNRKVRNVMRWGKNIYPTEK